MKRKFIKITTFVLIFTMLLSLVTFALPSLTVTDDQICLDANLNMGNGNATVMSISNPTRATLIVGTTSYAAPNPSTGYAQEVLPANTVIWVVEKKLYDINGNKIKDSNERYYYYAGYAYNGGSHRGYFCEDNVYVNGSRLLPANVTDETNDANLKAYTSLAGTVYDGPGTSYATMGTVGQESVKLIRTEGNYNLIEYTVTGTGKIKRGYLLYSLVKDVWSNLSANNAALNGQIFYLKNAKSSYYMQTQSDNPSAASRINKSTFDGNLKQLFKFTYDSAGKFFYIQPLSGESTNRILSISMSYTEHADRQLTINASSATSNQKFWIINVGTNKYKILPLSGYGTMSLTESGNYINQFYTQSGTSTYDTWIFEVPSVELNIQRTSQIDHPWCWAASAMTMASSEDEYRNPTIESVVTAVFGRPVEEGGRTTEKIEAANFCITGSITGNPAEGLEYVGDDHKIYTEETLRRFIKDGHAVSVSMDSQSDDHAITIYKFELFDDGKYRYYYFDSNKFYGTDGSYYEDYVLYAQLINGYSMYGMVFEWEGVCAFKTAYSENYITL